ncbi:MAG TPA: alginate lyase family protein [Pyrinomonadaceae bacterium]|nr:alginate lyase family protein [Pyrinomonadaceae bacterium]
MSITRKIKRALRGRVGLGAALLEAGRRGFVALRRRRERAAFAGATVNEEARAPQLAPEFTRMSGAELLAHFRTRETPRFFAGFEDVEREEGRALLARLAAGAFEEAREVAAHRWPVLGYGRLEFGAEPDWLREPASGVRWPLGFHADVRLVRGDGSDVRVLWELNRLEQLLTLGRAYALTRDETLAEEFFAQVESWRAQNPVGSGPNWACAMEAALRAMNLTAALRLFRRSRALTEARLTSLLALLDAHGRHVRRNLEFSYISTGNHYLSDVAGLLWLGLCLPELSAAEGWREFAFKELLRELDKQVLPDGADCEASTGYQRFVAELFLYSFLLCRANGFEFDEGRRARLRSMLEYVRAYLRPDGRAPLVGDTDGGQVLPLVRRAADDHAYLLGVGAALFKEPRFKIETEAPEEVFWFLGAEGVRAYEELETAGARSAVSEAFPHAGVCVLREGDLYLLLNASGAGLGGRGAHGHNDALAVEVSACGVSFLRDPGTYVYTSDTRARQLFRSTAYHSTVEVDGAEQNTTPADAPFFNGDEARPRILSFDIGEARDAASAEQHGYERLAAGPVTHRRTVVFDKQRRLWIVEDTLTGSGTHDFRFVFHAAPGLEARLLDAPASNVPGGAAVKIVDAASGASLIIVSLEGLGGVSVEPRWSSREYGSKQESAAAVWTVRAPAPLKARWLLLPVCAGEDAAARLELARGGSPTVREGV